MSNHYKLEEVTASNDDGDTVIINRIYELKINHNLDSSIDGNIYQPSNKYQLKSKHVFITKTL